MSRESQAAIDRFFAEHPEWRPYADIVLLPPSPEEIREEFPDADADVLARCWDGATIAVGTLYVRMRREGADDRWAAMCALRQPPRGETSDSFWAGRKHFSEVFGEKYANEVKARLAQRGVNLKPGDEYMPELARFKGDPEAVVPFSGARSYMRRLCERRGWGLEGAASATARQPESDPLAAENCVPLAEDLVRAKARELVSQNPDLKRLPKRELRQQVLDKYGPK